MLRITIPSTEQWNEFKNEFINTKEQTLQLEHSLVSLSKWEAKWGKPFLGDQEKTNEETLHYIKCMTLTQNVDAKVYDYMTFDNIREIKEYIENPMTATYFSDNKTGSNSSEQVTSELIYYWMITLNIPFECQKWHLNRLLTLVKVCQLKNQPPKKMSKSEIMTRNTALNEARRKQLNSKG